MSARYLIRFDDICPAMNWTVWDRVEPLLEAAGARPLLAVVPENHDPELNVAPPAANFWDRVRAWQSRGWAIGLHGYQHRYVTRSSGIIGRNRYSEFSGLDRAEQLSKIRSALAIFEDQGVRADAWVAPAHSFDLTTVGVLAECGLRVISDGYALRPFMDSRGMLWVPQQLGKFRAMQGGVWTVCLHVNRWTASDIEQFEASLSRFRGQLTTLSDLAVSYASRRADLRDTAFDLCFRAARSLRV